MTTDEFNMTILNLYNKYQTKEDERLTIIKGLEEKYGDIHNKNELEYLKLEGLNNDLKVLDNFKDNMLKLGGKLIKYIILTSVVIAYFSSILIIDSTIIKIIYIGSIIFSSSLIFLANNNIKKVYNAYKDAKKIKEKYKSKEILVNELQREKEKIRLMEIEENEIANDLLIYNHVDTYQKALRMLDDIKNMEFNNNVVEKLESPIQNKDYEWIRVSRKLLRKENNNG